MFKEKTKEEFEALTPDEQAKYLAEKETHDAAEAAKKGGAKKGGKVNDNAGGKTKEYFDKLGAKSKENRVNGGKDVEVSLTNKTLVRFTKDHGFFKKGHEQEVSDVAFGIYDDAGVIEKL